MSNYASSLPVKTESDLHEKLQTKLIDYTNPNSGATVSSGNLHVSVQNQPQVIPTDGVNSQSYTAQGEAKVIFSQSLPAGTNEIGTVNSNTQDGLGNDITSTNTGTKNSLDTALIYNDQAIDPRQVRALTSSDVVTANIKDATGNAFSQVNPLPVTVVDPALSSQEILRYNASVAVNEGAVATHTYTVPAGKILMLQQVVTASSGKTMMQVVINSNTVLTMFSTSANPNILYPFQAPQKVAAGEVVEIQITNMDKGATDLYSTLEGYLI